MSLSQRERGDTHAFNQRLHQLAAIGQAEGTFFNAARLQVQRRRAAEASVGLPRQRHVGQADASRFPGRGRGGIQTRRSPRLFDLPGANLGPAGAMAALGQNGRTTSPPNGRRPDLAFLDAHRRLGRFLARGIGSRPRTASRSCPDAGPLRNTVIVPSLLCDQRSARSTSPSNTETLLI